MCVVVVNLQLVGGGNTTQSHYKGEKEQMLSEDRILGRSHVWDNMVMKFPFSYCRLGRAGTFRDNMKKGK